MVAIVVPGPEVVIGRVHAKLSDKARIDAQTLDVALKALHRLRDQILSGGLRSERRVENIAVTGRKEPSLAGV
jgi:hypothetical protein